MVPGTSGRSQIPGRNLLLEQLGSGPSHPGAHGTDGAVEGLGRVGVGQAEELGHHEGLESIAVENLQCIDNVVPVIVGVNDGLGGGRPIQQPLTADPSPDRVGTDSASDGHQPASGRAFAVEPVEGTEGPFECLLGEIVGIRRGTQVRAEAMNV